MPCFRRLLVSIALLACFIGSARAETALQLSPSLAPAANLQGAGPAQTLALIQDRPLELGDDSPPIPTLDLTTQPDDLWQRVRNGFSMPNLESPLVAREQAWYLNRPELLKRIMERSHLYLFHIVSELEKRGMPTELALLPIVESSYNPLAHSPARALGMWQFIPSTGKNYNLKQNWWFDQRRDIIASTSAALDYLKDIYELHGDWHLALASYNWGEGAVGRAIAKNRAKGLPTDYPSLAMPTETRYYVPKLQAIKNIIAEPSLFNVHFDPIPNRPYFGIVERNGNMDVTLAARLAEIPVDQLIALNPAYSRPVMPDSANSPLVLPAGQVSTFLANLELHEAQDKPLSSWEIHTLRRGEKIDAIAAKYQISGAKLRQLNGITRKTRVVPGLVLLVPRKGALVDDSIGAKLPQTPTLPARKIKQKSGKKIKPAGSARRITSVAKRQAPAPRKKPKTH